MIGAINRAAIVQTPATLKDAGLPRGFSNNEAAPAQATLSSLAERIVGKADVVREVMSRYDFTNMRYTERVSVAEELRDAGVLSGEDFLHLTLPTTGYLLDGTRTPDWDVPQNMMEHFSRQVEFMSRNGSDRQSVDLQRRMLALCAGLQSFRP